MRVVEGAGGPRVLGKDTRLGRWATVEPATNSRATSSYTKHQLHGTLFLAQLCTQPAGTLKEGASQALVPIPLQARVL